MTDILGQFRDEELPPSRVDVQRAVRMGRRRRRMRTAVAAGGAALAVAAAGLTAPTWLTGQPEPVPPGDTCGSPQPARSTMPTWRRFDPLVAEIDASGVTGHQALSLTTTVYWQLLQLMGADRLATVALFACDGDPAVPDLLGGQSTPIDPTQGEPADPVAGAAAYWLPQNDPADPVALAWQWTPGGWAIVVPADPVKESPALSRDELRAIARQIAGELSLGVGRPVTSPIALPVPDGMHPVMTSVALHDPGIEPNGDPESAAPIGYAIGFDMIGTDRQFVPSMVAYRPSLMITVHGFGSATDGRPRDAIPYPEDLGYPAYYQIAPDIYPSHDQTNPDNRRPDLVGLLVYEFFGLGLGIAVTEEASSTEDKLRRAADIFRTISAYPDAATDPTAWGPPIR